MKKYRLNHDETEKVFQRLGGPEGARALEVLEKAEKEGEDLLLSHEEAGALLKALYEGLLRSLEEED